MTALLTGERLAFTALNEDDLKTISGWYQNVAFARRFDAQPSQPKPLGQLKKWKEQAEESNNHFLFGIREPGTDKLIGYIELEGILWNQRNGWVSIAIGDDAMQGKGYGTEAMELLMGFAFDELNLHRLQLTVFEYNTPAIAMYERLGFTYEGAQREFILRDGHAYDMYIYGLLQHEWREQN
ncbi:GNAT family N-acetyltransferase [Thalassobacillus sp. CUG 92003]|uniref:GNAT family N-acetyltransferase n=1 Tax=Thalassobacillus sp. CUG 92003 TaxID=2736641 RepID=UPI0015E75FF9|nr:GNAT family protein [Thalassobacillus sp. CUG 92003]